MKSPLNVIVGVTYDVPCIKDRYGKWFPIVGPEHIDGIELCQTRPIAAHYHIDRRFANYAEIKVGIQGFGEITYRPMVCLREKSDNGTLTWAMIRLGRMLQHYRINPVQPICPHNQQIVVNKDGQCPGHGFCWDMKTGRPKWEYPFFVRFKGTDYKYPVTDRAIIQMPYPLDAKKLSPDFVVELIDSNDVVIGEEVFKFHLGPGDTVKITTGCTENADT